MTILARLERELEAGAGGGAGGAGGAGVARLEPYLQPRAHQAYVAQRIRELARGGCLSAYKWDGGGDDWNDSKPTDAEIIMHLFATYVDSQAPRVAAAAGAGGAGAGAFSARHVSAAPARPPRSPRTLALHRASSRPPHYLLLLGEDTIEVCSGRNNVFHTLLVFLAAAARGAGGGGGGAVAGGLQLGRAGLNLLWVIGQ
ncbi:unnamed protein product [Plutella xylostella]|uniref:(diamondback moth) hypothetical protein n=1 Tax=Plutella xylostella TaxID=51655 RepID=A0A8S4FH75_PLUXY|nr:unnamed protein product [Plutella xylostella]